MDGKRLALQETSSCMLFNHWIDADSSILLFCALNLVISSQIPPPACTLYTELQSDNVQRYFISTSPRYKISIKIIVIIIIMTRTDQPKSPAVAIVRQNGLCSASSRASVADTPVSRQIWWTQVVDGGTAQLINVNYAPLNHTVIRQSSM